MAKDRKGLHRFFLFLILASCIILAVSIDGTANIMKIYGPNGRPQWVILDQNTTMVGVNTDTPNATLDVNGTIYENGSRVCTAANGVCGVAAADGNNYPVSLSMGIVGYLLSLQLERSGLSNISASVTLPDDTVALSSLNTSISNLSGNGTNIQNTLTSFGVRLNTLNSSIINVSGNTSNLQSTVTAQGVRINTLNESVINKTTAFGGDVSGTYDNVQLGSGVVGATELASSGVSAGLYGNGSVVPTLTIDADGRVTASSNTTISITSEQLSDIAYALINSSMLNTTNNPTGSECLTYNSNGQFTWSTCGTGGGGSGNITGNVSPFYVPYAGNSTHLENSALRANSTHASINAIQQSNIEFYVTNANEDVTVRLYPTSGAYGSRLELFAGTNQNSYTALRGQNQTADWFSVGRESGNTGFGIYVNGTATSDRAVHVSDARNVGVDIAASTLFKLLVNGSANISTLTLADLTAANCDVKAYVNGTVYCGTDQTGGSDADLILRVDTLNATAANSSGNWTNAHLTLTAQGVRSNTFNSTLANNSGNWTNAHTTLTTFGNSITALGVRADTLNASLANNSGNWTNAYLTLTAQGVRIDTLNTTIANNSGNWTNVHLTVTAQGVRIDTLNATLANNSGNWSNAHLTLTAQGVRSNTFNTTLANNSGNWTNALNTLNAKGYSNVTLSGVANQLLFYSSASSAISRLLYTTDINTSNTGSTDLVLAQNSTGGMYWKTDATGSGSFSYPDNFDQDLNKSSNVTHNVVNATSRFGAGYGSAGSPAYTFNGNNDSGYYSDASGQHMFSCDGVKCFQANADGIQVAQGSGVFPGIQSVNDDDTGIYWPTTDTLAFTAAGNAGGGHVMNLSRGNVRIEGNVTIGGQSLQHWPILYNFTTQLLTATGTNYENVVNLTMYVPANKYVKYKCDLRVSTNLATTGIQFRINITNGNDLTGIGEHYTSATAQALTTASGTTSIALNAVAGQPTNSTPYRIDGAFRTTGQSVFTVEARSELAANSVWLFNGSSCEAYTR